MPTTTTKKDLELLSKRLRKKAVLWFLAPFAGIMSTLFLFAVVNTIARVTQASPNFGDASWKTLIIKIINYILTLSGAGAVILLPLGIILGILSLRKAGTLEQNAANINKTGLATLSSAPEITGWSWGGAGLGLIWGIFNGVWISLLGLIIPFWWIVLGIKGNQWAWETGRWKSPQEFKASQKPWKIVGMAILVARVVLVFIIILFGALSIAFAPHPVTPVPATSPFADTKPLNIIQTQNGKSEVVDSEGNYKISYDSKKWTVEKIEKLKEDDIPGYAFIKTDNENVYAAIGIEKVEIPLDALKEAISNNTAKEAHDVKIISEEKRMVNGNEILALQITGILEEAAFAQYNYYYSDNGKTIIFISATTPDLFSKYKNDMEELLNGLSISH